MGEVAESIHRWTRAEYERIVDTGGFEPETRLELLDGEIVDMSPQQSRHATAVDLVEQALRACVGPDFYVRGQKPLALDAYSEPEPDLAVVSGGPRDYVDQHPTRAALIVEVADTSLALDRGRKAAAYARNGIREYWVLNLRDRRLHVHRAPEGDAYANVSDLDSEASLAPLVCPHRPLRVSDLPP